MRDYVAWHDAYDDPTSSLAARLAIVRRRLAEALDRCPPGPIRVVSMCAGQGHDVLGVLPDHPRRDDVRARLVELEERNASVARRRAAGLAVEVVTGDAGRLDAYLGAVPADVVLAAGIFGNVPDDDVRRTVLHLPMLCAPGATVLWTRRRDRDDLTGAIEGWFREAGFERRHLDVDERHPFSVGTEVLVGPPAALDPSLVLFRFTS
jgi:hypothetical protein